MAKPITSIKRYQVPREEQVENDVNEVKQAVADNKEAILKGIQLLSSLEEEGTLDAAYSFSKKKEQILANVVKELNREQYTPMLENIPELVFLLGEIDGKALRETMARFNRGLEEMESTDEDKKTSVFELAKSLKDPEINRSITMLMQFLKGMGKSQG
ncbi:DUF1641 domain-containing protein [Halobacillus salinarum]|uniref:DUF1641 domain-containing protein n=1 Tax=Halobacillus salinarum TaxID=2932257 RepID=A0ABY4EFM5_9BACI|nr:DUF1641 domain-containing protein [Halobacillus salinarum]UOQ43268.1 DUF1641 domain-containing protein [Halobacillus salinarum]